MNVNVATEGNNCRIVVEGEMTIGTAAELLRGLATPLVRCEDIEVNLAGVSEIDSAGLQLMVAAKREAVTKNKTLRFVEHSQVVLDVLDLCDLAGHFGDPLVLRSQAA
ncbi:MAG: STAS domain-containing protein [Sulfuritalea sp.]|jgi:anti-anti-sigma factor|nr:STAS domain-containing protein [Sulfuritalea sp.]